MNTHLSDSPADLQSLAETVRELNACRCDPRADSREQHSIVIHALAYVLLHAHDNGLVDYASTWEHLRFHLDAWKAAA